MKRSDVVAIALAAACAVGCAPRIRSAARDVPREAVPVIADESLKVLEDAGTRERIVAVSGTPELQQALREVAGALVDGSIDAVASDATNERLRIAIEKLFGALSPAIHEAIRDATVTGSRALAEQISDPEVRRAIRELTDEMVHAAVEGTRQALVDIRKDRETSGTGVIERVERVLWISLGATFALGAATIMLLAWALRLHKRVRRHDAMMDEESKTRRRTLEDAPAT